MFSSKEQLQRKTGPSGIGRFSYLQSLVTEYQYTSSEDGLEETDDALVEFAVGGLCNACLDKKNKEYILQNDGVKLVVKCLSSANENTVLSAITTLMYLVTPESKAEITSLPVVECMLRFSQSMNIRLRNLATVFLEDYCSREQMEEARAFQASMGSQPTAEDATQSGVAPALPETEPAQDQT